MLSHFFKKNKDTQFQYKKAPLFSSNELFFYRHLQMILPHRQIFPHLHLSSIVSTSFASSSSAASNPNANKELAQQRHVLKSLMIDFAIFDDNQNLIFAIELEGNPRADGSEPAHSVSQYLKEIGIPCIKWRKSRLPNFEQMERLLAPFVNDISEKEAQEIVALSVEDLDIKNDESKEKPSHTTLQRKETKEEKDAREFEHLRKATPIPVVELTITNEHNNPHALSLRFLRDLTPQNFIKKEYPHIWHRICLFAEDPPRLNLYLDTLFSQNRPNQRQGLPEHVAQEVILIKAENKNKLAAMSEKII